MKQAQITNKWRTFLTEAPHKENEISPEVLALLFSDEITALLQNGTINEGLQDRAKRIAIKLGIPLALAMALMTGGLTGQQLAKIQNAQSDDIEQVDTAKASLDLPPGYSDLSNQSAMEKAWNDIEPLLRQSAPVSGTAPVMVDGDMRILSFSYIPANEISDDTVLPMSLMKAGEYRAMWETKVNSNEKEILYLQRMIFGDTGKWASGLGNALYKVEGNSALLPPEWTIAHDVYANAVESRVLEIDNYVRQNPEQKEAIYAELGVENDEQLFEFLNDQLIKIGRQ